MVLSHWLENQDLFGHHVHLNFNRQGHTHKTAIGGLVSILVKAFMVGYFALLVKKMVLFEDDRFKSQSFALSSSESSGYKFEDLHQTYFFMVKDGVGFYNISEMERYFTLRASNVEWDNTVIPQKMSFSNFVLGKECSAEKDFG